ncbi:MAG TPA: hypothetical protein VF134_04310 [Candidatus Dormibacteraeota bacterium]
MNPSTNVAWSGWPPSLWGYDFSPSAEVDFCVSALLADGLSVSPFVRHRAGDGRLRDAGLTAELWSEWFEKVIESEVAWRAEMIWPRWRRAAEWPPTRDELDTPAHVPRRAVDLWNGSTDVRRELERQASIGASHRLTISPRTPGPGSVDASTNELLRSFRGRIPQVWVFPVQYPSLVDLTLAPVAIVVSDRVVRNPELYRAALVRSFEKLNLAGELD